MFVYFCRYHYTTQKIWLMVYSFWSKNLQIVMSLRSYFLRYSWPKLPQRKVMYVPKVYMSKWYAGQDTILLPDSCVWHSGSWSKQKLSEQSLRKWYRNVPSVFNFFTSQLYLCHVASLYIFSKACFYQSMQIIRGRDKAFSHSEEKQNISIESWSLHHI